LGIAALAQDTNFYKQPLWCTLWSLVNKTNDGVCWIACRF